MKNLFKWEMKQTLSSKVFRGIGIALFAATVLMTLLPLFDDVYTGFDVFLHGCNNFNSFVIFFIGIFTAVHVTGAFEERRIQAVVMAGNSRFSVLLAKLASFSLSVAAFGIVTLTSCAVLAFSVKGIDGFDGSFLSEVVMRIALYPLVEVSFSSVCFFLSMMVKNLGASVMVNLVALLGLNSLVQPLIGKEWAEGIIKYTPVGQTFMLLADASTKNLIVSAAVSLLGLAVTMVLSFVKFRNEELK